MGLADIISMAAFPVIIGIVITAIVYYIRKSNNRKEDLDTYMTDLYSTTNGFIRPITASDPDCSGNLYDYYIQTAYNACSGGTYMADYVSIVPLQAVLKQGVRCLDFEIYSLDNEAIVSTSTSDSYYFKETYNSVPFSTVMETISNYAFATGTAPNPTDPVIIHLRFKSANQEMYTNLASTLKLYDNIMLGKEYSFENSGTNLGQTPLLTFKNKVILIVDRSNDSFLQNAAFLEYVNLTSNSLFMRGYRYFDVKNNPDVQELTEYNKTAMTIVFPDKGADPPNPSGPLCRTYGCQMIAMQYQKVENMLIENRTFFEGCGYAFCLKPANLRNQPVTIPVPTPQNPAYSYATRNVSTDYYSFKI